MSVITTKDGIKYEGENSGSLDNFNVYTKTESDASYVKLPTVDATQLIDLIYPIGSIYMSVTQTSPASFLGGTWTPLEEGKALWTTTTASTGGATIAAGLPNITGHAGADGLMHGAPATPQIAQGNGQATGAIAFSYHGFNYESGFYTNQGNTNYAEGIGQGDLWIDASYSNSIYGKSDTVQPPAIKVYAWQRVANAS